MVIELDELKQYIKNEIPIEHWLSLINDEDIQDKINDARKKLGKRIVKFPPNFEPPTYKDILVYMTEYKGKMGLIMDEKRQSANFFDRQSQIGWMIKVGNNLFPMKDWKAAVRTHLRVAFDYGQIKKKEG